MAMTSTFPPLLRLQIAILLGLLALCISATARPCRTFFISSYSFSFPAGDRRHLPADHKPSSATFATFTEIRSSVPIYVVSNDKIDKPSFPSEIFFDRSLPGHRIGEKFEIERRASQIRSPFGFSAYDFSSLRDRTKDILSVVVALLFGVGCGALTAATMYLVWSVFSNRYDYHASYDDYVDDDDNHEGEIESPKKMGYVKIPAAEAVPAAPTKEAV